MHDDDLNQFSPFKQRFEKSISGKYATNIEKMFYLCKNGHLNVLKSFLEDSNDKNPQDDDKYSILHCAVEHGKVDIVEYLVPLLSEKNPCAVPRAHSTEGLDYKNKITITDLKSSPVVVLVLVEYTGTVD